jgi:hypothetical protein
MARSTSPIAANPPGRSSARAARGRALRADVGAQVIGREPVDPERAGQSSAPAGS